jgi:hypothetical protein
MSSTPVNVLKLLATAAATSTHAVKKEAAGERPSGVKREIRVKVESKSLDGNGGGASSGTKRERESSNDDSRDKRPRGASGDGADVGKRVLRGDVKKKMAPRIPGGGGGGGGVDAGPAPVPTSKKARVHVKRVEEDKSSDGSPLQVAPSSASLASASSPAEPAGSDASCSILERDNVVPVTCPPPTALPRVKREGGTRAPGNSRRKASSHGVDHARITRINFVNKLCEHVRQRQEL